MHGKGFQEYRGVFSYLSDRIKQNGIFSAANKVVKYARRYFFITRIIKYTSFVIAIIETSAILIVLTAILSVAIPVMLISTAIATLISLHKRKEFNAKLSPLFERNKNIMFIYTDHGFYNKKSVFLRGMASDFKDRGYTVFVVSSSPIYDRFTTAKEIEDDLFVIKLGYFYSLKRNYIKKLDPSKQTYIS